MQKAWLYAGDNLKHICIACPFVFLGMDGPVTGGGLRNQHQPGGGHLEEQNQGAVPQPQRLLFLHGRFFDCNRSCDIHHDDSVKVDLQEVRLGRGCTHHPNCAADHRYALDIHHMHLQFWCSSASIPALVSCLPLCSSTL